MQPKTHWLLALAVAASATGLAAGTQLEKTPQKDGVRPSTSRPVAPAAEDPKQEEESGSAKADAALDELADRIEQRHLEAADLEPVKTALRERVPVVPPDPRAQARLTRMEQALDSFPARLKSNKLTRAHVDMIREQLVDERLDRVVERLREAAAAGKVSDEEYRAVARQLARRAEVSRSFDTAANAMLLQLQGRLEEHQRRSKDKPVGADDVIQFRNELIDLRLEHSITTLEERAADEDLTRADLARLRGILQDHAVDAKNDPEFSSMRTRLDNALDALEQKVADGKAEAADVAALRGLLTKLAHPKGPRNEPKPDGPKPENH